MGFERHDLVGRSDGLGCGQRPRMFFRKAVRSSDVRPDAGLELCLLVFQDDPRTLPVLFVELPCALAKPFVAGGSGRVWQIEPEDMLTAHEQPKFLDRLAAEEGRHPADRAGTVAVRRLKCREFVEVFPR